MKRVVMLLLVAGSAAAAQAPQTIAPGMSRAEVVARLGAPLASRTLDGNTYLYYANGCERRCGMQDLVVLDSDRVVDAIFRSPTRRYTGVSSSPEAVPAATAVRQAGTPRTAAPLRVPDARPDHPARPDSTVPAHREPVAARTSVPPQRPETSAAAPARSEIRIPMIGTPNRAAPGAPADTVRQPVQPARRPGD